MFKKINYWKKKKTLVIIFFFFCFGSIFLGFFYENIVQIHSLLQKIMVGFDNFECLWMNLSIFWMILEGFWRILSDFCLIFEWFWMIFAKKKRREKWKSKIKMAFFFFFFFLESRILFWPKPFFKKKKPNF